MSFGTLLTVFVVPTMYSLFARKKIPGANKADALDQPASSVQPH
jgi:multidrug efflux pump